MAFAPHPPRPFAPTGAKGSLNSRFGVFAPDTRLTDSCCGAGLSACIGLRGGRSQWFDWLVPAVARLFCVRDPSIGKS